MNHTYKNLRVALQKNWSILALLTTISLLNGGIGIGIHNHSVYFIKILRLNDPTLFPYGSFADAMEHTYSLYWHLIALGARYMNLNVLLVIVHILCRGIFFTGVFSLGYSLFKKSNIALIGVLLLVFDLRTILVTLSSMTDVTPTHTALAIALAIWAMVFLLERKLIVCAIILGLICQINLMNGLLYCFVFGIAMLSDWRNYRSWQLPAGAILWLIISFTALKWSLGTSPPDVPMSEYMQILKDFFWFHLFPLTWGVRIWIQLSGLLAVVALCLAVKGAFPRQKVMYGILTGIILTWLIQLFVSVVPSLQFLVQLQWGRTCAMLIIMMLPIMAYVLTEWLPQKKAAVSVSFCIVLVGGWMAAHGSIPAMLLLAVFGWRPFCHALKKLRIETTNKLFNSGVIVLETVLILFLLFNFIDNAAEKGFKVQTPEKNWLAAQAWAKESTPPDALFLTPSDMRGFRVYSERSVYFTWENIAPIKWNPNLTGRVMKKNEEILELGIYNKPYQNVSPQKIIRFCEKRGIDYLVLPTSIRLEMKPCYRNDKWSIFKLSKKAGKKKKA